MSQSTVRSLVACGWGAALCSVVLLAPPVQAAATTADAKPDDGKRACVAQHEEAQLLRRDGKLTGARTALLACVADNCPAVVSADCAEWLGAVTAAMPSVIVRAGSGDRDEEDVRVTVDGELVAARLDGRPIDVDPGLHTFRFEAPSRGPVEQQITISEGEKNRIVDVRFELPEPAATTVAPAATYRPVPTLAGVLAGVAVLGVGGFAVFGLWGWSEKASLQSTCAPSCNDSQIGSVRTKFVAADAAMGIAVLSLAGGAYVYFSRPALERREAHRDGYRLAPRAWTTVAIAPGLSGVTIAVQGAL